MILHKDLYLEHLQNRLRICNIIIANWWNLTYDPVARARQERAEIRKEIKRYKKCLRGQF